MNKLIITSILLAVFALNTNLLSGQQPDPPGQALNGKPVNEAYLFAHMTHEDYGRLYYSVSLDGLHWTRLNEGKRVFEAYKGHPDICKGHDNRYYIAGNQSDASPVINFWVSDDLIKWEKYSEYTPDLQKTPGYENALPRIGAPKIYYDASTQTYILTWHTPHEWGTDKDPEKYWASQRTLYVTSKDLKTFPAYPQRLFEWEMGTIDVSIQKIKDTYYAVLKDERYPTLQWVTGKTIRISSASSLTGPYSYPGNPISPNFREAPMLIPSPNDSVWYMYYEQYPGVSYGLSVARNPEGPWYQISGYTFFSDWDKYFMPPKLRHGCMITITREQYDKLVEHFGKDAS